MRTSVLVTGSVATLLLLSACKEHTLPKEFTAQGASGPRDPNLSVKAGGYHGNHFSGPIYIPWSSPMEDGTTAYDVTYQDGVTLVSKDDTMRHLVTIQKDGSYIFDSSANQIAHLKPGGILLLSGLALCTVVDVKKIGDSYSLRTGPARITDAIKDGRLEGTYQIDFRRMQAGRSALPSKSLLSSFPFLDAVSTAAADKTIAQDPGDFDVNFGSYNYHVRFMPGRDRINVLATIKFGGSQGKLAYEGVGYLSNFVSTIKIQIKDGELTTLEFTNSNLTGQVELKWFATATSATRPEALAKITSWPAELSKSALLSKAAYHVPLLLGAVPFDLRISLGFSFIPSFSSKDSMVEGSKLIQYSGGGGFGLSNGRTKPYGSINVQGDISGYDNRVEAAGPVGFTAATEAPRLELAMGWPPEALPVAGFLNFIASYGTVTNGMAGPAPCQTNVMAFSVNSGAIYSPPTFAAWGGSAPGASSSVSLWQKTYRTAGAGRLMCRS